MPVVPTQEIVQRAFTERYGVAAINVVNDLTMEAVLAAAEELRAPLIVQTSVKTVKSIGADVLFAMWTEMTRDLAVPVALHLDHCPEREVITLCLEKGWNSVLFDGSKLTRRGEQAPDDRGRRRGASLRSARRGRDRGVQARRGDGRRRAGRRASARNRARLHPLDAGRYLCTRHRQRARHVQDDAEAGQPAGHRHRRGDRKACRAARRNGHDAGAVQDLIARGCAKVNISTALKIAFIQSGYDYVSEHPTEYDPPKLFVAQRAAVLDMAKEHIAKFGAQGRAW